MDWTAVIGKLIDAFIAKCFSETSSENPHDVLRENYNEATGRMNPDLVNACIPAARRAANRAHREASPKDRKTFPKRNRADHYAASEKQLIAALNADGPKIDAMLAAGRALGDDE